MSYSNFLQNVSEENVITRGQQTQSKQQTILFLFLVKIRSEFYKKFN